MDSSIGKFYLYTQKYFLLWGYSFFFMTVHQLYQGRCPNSSPVSSLSRTNIPIFPRGNMWFSDPFMGFSPYFYLVSPNHQLNYASKWVNSVTMLEAPGLMPRVWTSSQNFMCLNKVLELYPKRPGSWRQRRSLTEVHKKHPDVGRKTSMYHLIEYLKCIQFLLGHNLEVSHYLRYSETVVSMDVYICIISSFGTLILLGSLERKGSQVRRHFMLNHVSCSALRTLNSYAFIIFILSQEASLLHAKCE